MFRGLDLLQRSKTPRRLGSGQGRQLALGMMVFYQRGYIDVANAIAVGETERFFALQIRCHTFQASACHGVIAGINQRHAPRFGILLVDFHFVVAHVEGHVGHVQEIVGEVFLDQVTLVSATDDEIIHPVGGIDFHHMPQDRLAADLDHRLGLEVGFFGDSGSEATGEDHCFHSRSTIEFISEYQMQDQRWSRYKARGKGKVQEA